LHHQRAHMHIVYSFYQKPEEKWPLPQKVC
jgi:hypothetical protein